MSARLVLLCGWIRCRVIRIGAHPGVLPVTYPAGTDFEKRKLKLEPHFADYVGEAFKPLGVYVNFFQPTLAPGAERSFSVEMVNDAAKPVAGELTLSLETEGGRELARAAQRFELGALGDATVQVPLTIPNAAGKCILKASARPEGGGKTSATVSRRWVRLEHDN